MNFLGQKVCGTNIKRYLCSAVERTKANRENENERISVWCKRRNEV